METSKKNNKNNNKIIKLNNFCSKTNQSLDQHPVVKRATVYMLSNHIGCALDIPQRALAVLQVADLLVFEEDKGARQALKSAQIHREYLKFSEHGQLDVLDTIKKTLKKGLSVAYMSDQGSPTISDPGSAILELVYELNANVKVVPGPSSVTAALSACPFDIKEYFFAGFLPREQNQRVKALRQVLQRSESIVLMDTPYRLKSLLELFDREIGKKRRGFLACNASCDDEQYYIGSWSQLLKTTSALGKNTNFIVIIAPQHK